MAKVSKSRRRGALIGTIVVIILAAALMLYFVFREHFASALVGVAGLVIGVVSLVFGVIPLFQQRESPKAADPGQSPKADTIMTVNTGSVQGSQVVAGGSVILEHDPHEYGKPEFPMTRMQRPRSDGSSADSSAGQQT